MRLERVIEGRNDIQGIPLAKIKPAIPDRHSELLFLDSIRHRFAILHGWRPFGGSLDYPYLFLGKVFVGSRSNGYMTDFSVFPDGEFIADDGVFTYHGFLNNGSSG